MADIILDPEILTQDTHAALNENTVYIDRILENDGINVSATYGAATDRVYDVRGFLGFFTQIQNPTGSAEAIDVLIQKATRHPENVSDTQESPVLNDDDFTELVAEQEVAIGEFSSAYELVRATPMITFIRIRMKLASGSTPQIATGITSVN